MGLAGMIVARRIDGIVADGVAGFDRGNRLAGCLAELLDEIMNRLGRTNFRWVSVHKAGTKPAKENNKRGNGKTVFQGLLHRWRLLRRKPPVPKGQTSGAEGNFPEGGLASKKPSFSAA